MNNCGWISWISILPNTINQENKTIEKSIKNLKNIVYRIYCSTKNFLGAIINYTYVRVRLSVLVGGFNLTITCIAVSIL